MKIAQVVTLVSSGGVFGGPTSVATNQATVLQGRGHEVTLFAGWDGQAPVPNEFSSRLRKVIFLFPGELKSMVCLPLLLNFWRSRRKFDLVHIHLSVDLITTPVAILCALTGTRYVIQTHGMVKLQKSIPKKLINSVVILRVLRRACFIIALSEKERQLLIDLGADVAKIRIVPNGSRPCSLRASWQPTPLVGFVSRIHPRKRVAAFLEMAETLRNGGLNARYAIFGPDGGEATFLRQQLDVAANRDIQYFGSLRPEDVSSKLSQMQLLVLPSYNEPFPMVILEAFSVHLPVVITNDNGLAPLLRSESPASVSDGAVESMARSAKYILSCESSWDQAAAAGGSILRRHLSLDIVGEQLESEYLTATGTSP